MNRGYKDNTWGKSLALHADNIYFIFITLYKDI